MENSREEMIGHLERCRQIDLRELIFGEKRPLPPEKSQSMIIPRVIIPLSGEKKISFALNQKNVSMKLHRGQALFLGPYCWTIADWYSEHEMVSIVWMRGFLRVIYIDNKDNEEGKPPGPTHFYHVQDSFNLSTIFTFRALVELSRKPDALTCGKDMTKSLIELVLRDTKSSKPQKHGKAHSSWMRTCDYIAQNCCQNIGREDVANYLNCTPEYVSKLFSTFSNGTFTEYLNKTRVLIAAECLQSSNMTLDEIAQHCGFNYTSYFLRVFKKAYGVTPSKYRQNKPLGENSIPPNYLDF